MARARNDKGQFVKGGGKPTLRITDDTLFKRLDQLPAKVDSALFATTEYYRPRVESHAKSTAPWTDRTGNARSGLMATTEHKPDLHAINLFHTVPYGIWLEVRWGGRYAVILPTIQSQGRELMNTLRSIFGRMQ